MFGKGWCIFCGRTFLNFNGTEMEGMVVLVTPGMKNNYTVSVTPTDSPSSMPALKSVGD
jgi:hypothetical protein